MALRVYSGVWVKLIYDKNLKSKIWWQCPFRLLLTVPATNILSKFYVVFFFSEILKENICFNLYPQTIRSEIFSLVTNVGQDINIPGDMLYLLNTTPVYLM
jgi:hypothetical protein